MKKLFDDEAVGRRFHRGQWRVLGMTIIGVLSRALAGEGQQLWRVSLRE